MTKSSWLLTCCILQLVVCWPASASDCCPLLKGLSSERYVIYGGEDWIRFKGPSAWTTLYKCDPTLKKEDAIYKQATPIERLCVSSQGISAFGCRTGQTNSTHTRAIRFVSSAGVVLKTLETPEQVMSISWSPDGNKVSYVTGREVEGKTEYKDSATWLLPLESCEPEMIAPGGHIVTWESFDNNIYIYYPSSTPAVRRYRTDSGQLEDTLYKYIWFSSDGRYYTKIKMSNDISLVYDTAANALLQSTPDNPVPRRVLETLALSTWLDDRLVVGSQQSDTSPNSLPDNFIVNIENGEVRKARGLIMRKWDENTLLEIMPNGALQLESISDMPVVKPEGLPDRELDNEH